VLRQSYNFDIGYISLFEVIGTVAASGVPRNFVLGGGGFQQIQLRTKDRENGDLGAVAP